MPTSHFDVASLKEAITGKLFRYYGKEVKDATPQQLYRAVTATVSDEIMQRWASQPERDRGRKKVYYLSVEFLTGRQLNCNMINLLSRENYMQAMRELGIDPTAVLLQEPEPALGNGGLGRLAACFLDSLASENLPAMGCTIRYEYGLFRQRIVDGEQVEMPDDWLENGNLWEVCRAEDTCTVDFYGQVEESQENGRTVFCLKDSYQVDAVPYDMPVVGYDGTTVNTLRLWSSKARSSIDLGRFSAGDYAHATDEIAMAEVIDKVLYPEDSHWEGKMLRLKQHYFFVSATLQIALRDFKREYGNRFYLLPDYVTFHINDTHPGLCIPELMRLLVDQENVPWDEAQNIVIRCVAYTNHTVLSEALEKWPCSLIQNTLPRIYMILEELNRRLCDHLFQRTHDLEKVSRMAIISYNQVHMANLCASLSFSVNGVSQLHGVILMSDLFRDNYELDPYKFTAITNGITHRRWLIGANPALCDLLRETIGDGFIRDANQLEELLPFREDAGFRDAFDQVKQKNKARFSDYMKKRFDISVPTDFIFDVQSKRLHEYKRQILNALHIHTLYNHLLDDPDYPMTPRAFFFGAKAAAGYQIAKITIRYINELSRIINNDPRVNQKLRVYFVENYDVSTAELLIPATEVSQQLSTAGKEASGTGNMKFMMNGAVTLGTMDGANVEMFDRLGSDHIYIFGMRADTVANLYQSNDYNPMQIFDNNQDIRRAMTEWTNGTLFPDNPHVLERLYRSLLVGEGGARPDNYFVLKDYGSYVMANRRLMADYENREKWLRMEITNVAESGYFSSDRSIHEYNEKIWKIKP